MANAGRTLDRDAVRAILDERARILARPASNGEPDETSLLAVLSIGDEQYGVDVRSVREIRRCETITPLPGTPAFWLGLVNVRGRLLPALDLARLLALPDMGALSKQVLVIVEAANLEVALAVERMPEVRRLRQAEVGPPIGEAAELSRDSVRGVTSDLLTVLDLAVLLADPRLVVQATHAH